MTPFEVIRFANPTSLALGVATRWLDTLARRSVSDGRYCVALSGGRIAKEFYDAVVAQSLARSIALDEVHFFWGDERCVPPGHAESNFGAANERLFRPLRIAEEQIHRLRGEDPEEIAVAQAEAEICRLAALNDAGQPVLDLVLLGMGEDGHVASLFPEEPPSMIADQAVYRGVTATKPPPQRITVGYGVIAAAREVWVMASGVGKAKALQASLAPDGKTPLAHVLRAREETFIFTDIEPPQV